jgi:hypothetical protein
MIEKEKVSKAIKKEAAQHSELSKSLKEHGLSMEELTKEVSDAIRDMGADEEVQEAVHEFLVKEGFVKGGPSKGGPPPSKGEKKETPKEKED